MALNYRPLVYMWIAEYSDGFALPQFDPESGKENPFSAVDQSRLCRFGWYPFSVEMMRKILKADGISVIPTHNPIHTIELSKNNVLVAKRTNEVAIFHYRECGICSHRWQQTDAPKSALVGLPVSNEFYTEDIKAGDRIVHFSSPICPMCGYHDTNAIMMADKKIRRYSSEARKTFYVLGVEGGKIKRIGENGCIVEPIEKST